MGLQLKRLLTKLAWRFRNCLLMLISENFTALQQIALLVVEKLVAGFVKFADYVAWGAKFEGLITQMSKLIKNNPILRAMMNTFAGIAENLGLGRDRVQEFKAEQEGMADGPSKALDKFSKVPPKIEDAKDATKALTAAQREYQAALGAETGDIDH